MNYDLRVFRMADAAHALRMPMQSIKDAVRRYGMGIRLRGRRLFSIRDLTEFKTARNLSGPDLPIADALAITRQHLATEPPDGTSLILTDDGDHWIQPDEQEWLVGPCRIVHPGWIVQDIRSRLNVALE